MYYIKNSSPHDNSTHHRVIAQSPSVCVIIIQCQTMTDHQTSNISHTKSPNFNVSCLLLQLSLPNPLKQGVKSRMKMELEQHRQAMLQLHLINQSIKSSFVKGAGAHPQNAPCRRLSHALRKAPVRRGRLLSTVFHRWSPRQSILSAGLR